MEGWIKLYRGITDHWVWQDPEYLKAWIDLLLLVSHRETAFKVKGQIVRVSRGQFWVSTRFLSQRWKWGRKKVDSFLKLLEKEKMLDLKRATNGTLLTVVKYDYYQIEGQQKGQQKSHSGAIDEPQRSQNQELIIINKNVEEEGLYPPTAFMLFQKEFGRPLTYIETQRINDLENDWGYDITKEALTRAVIQGVRNIRYVESILNKWQSANCRTIQEVLEFEQRVEKQKEARKVGSPDVSQAAVKSMELEQKAHDETVKAATSYIIRRLGKNPPKNKAEELAKGYGEQYVAPIMENLYKLKGVNIND